MISIIVAMSKNRVIGKDGQLPWHLPSDLQHFKQLTMGHTLMMGRRTFESIGHPLPGRRTIVLSQNPEYRIVDCEVVTNIEDGIQLAHSTEELFVCGGAEVYRQTLALAERIYLTELEIESDGNALFPKFPVEDFKTIFTRRYKDIINYQFSILQRCASRKKLSSELKAKLIETKRESFAGQ